MDWLYNVRQIPREPKRECANGHQLAGDNIYVRPSGWRECRTCCREHDRRYKRSRKEASRMKSENRIRRVLIELRKQIDSPDRPTDEVTVLYCVETCLRWVVGDLGNIDIIRDTTETVELRRG